MKCKTISGHYDSVYSVAHNNRAIISKNVDVSRSGRNYYCVSAGDPVLFGPSDPQFLHEFWSQYRALSNRYWEDRAVVKHQELEKYWARMRHLRALSRAWCEMPNNTVLAWIWLLTLPLRIPCGIYITNTALCLCILYKWEYSFKNIPSHKFDKTVQNDIIILTKGGENNMQKHVYTVCDIAEILQVSPKTVYRMVKSGDIGALWVRGQIRITAESLEAYLKGENTWTKNQEELHM